MNCVRKTNQDIFGGMASSLRATFGTKPGLKNFIFGCGILAYAVGACVGVAHILTSYRPTASVALIIITGGLLLVIASIVYLVQLYINCQDEATSDE